MKKVYQTPEMMAAEMMSLSMVAASEPKVKIGTGSVAAESVGVKESAWDDFDE